MGLTGMRERLHAVGGAVEVRNGEQGAEVVMRLPVIAEALS
jgi:signal transduction histidine kinase